MVKRRYFGMPVVWETLSGTIEGIILAETRNQATFSW